MDGRSGLSPDSATELGAGLLERGAVSPDALARARSIEADSGDDLATILTRLGIVSEQTLVDYFSEATGLPRVGDAEWPQTGPVIAAEQVSVAFLRDHLVMPIASAGQTLVVAISDPLQMFAAEALGQLVGMSVTCRIAARGAIEAAIDRLYGTGRSEDALMADADEDDLERLRDLVSDAPVIRAVNRLIADAVDARASDIHLEPTEDRLAVRYRIDGVLVEQPALPPQMRAALVSRIKVMAELNIAERRLPQDGRLRVAVRGHEIDLRVAIAPSIHGQTVVLRILDKSGLALDFKELGFAPELAQRMQDTLARPHGIMLVTGPTGSGKTTTLYAALATINAGTRKILTVEDPIEYRLPGIVQTQVNPAIGLDFAAALRSFLRQDPDVMMVGEIRDLETAQIAIQAALTGHGLLSTLHTNSAAGAITRLLDMQVEPFLLASTLNAVVAQRLVRRLCPHCKVPHTPGPGQRAALGCDEHATFWRGAGCAECGHTGFKGRIALVEFLEVDETVAQLILDRADAREIARRAGAGQLYTMMEDGLAKASAGLTTVDEVLRVTLDG
ncbi:MAG: type II secretion system protein GspE [Porphyrobacter sp. IPPAS B-1204]|nr:MAG: type II secretion system protein GspE [Porphyrobacter sp. IPPAS B-1204]